MKAGPPPNVAFGKKIRDSRRERGWSQSALGEKSDLTRPTIARIERGDDVSTATLTKVAAALNLEVELKRRD